MTSEEFLGRIHNVWRLFKTCPAANMSARERRYCLTSWSSNKNGTTTANSADTLKVWGQKVNILAQKKASDWRSVQPKQVTAPTRLPVIYPKSTADRTTGRREEGVCMFTCVCYVCVMCVYMCMCKDRGQGGCFCFFTRGGSSCSLWFFLCSFVLQREDSRDMRWDKNNQLKLEESTNRSTDALRGTRLRWAAAATKTHCMMWEILIK